MKKVVDSENSLGDTPTDSIAGMHMPETDGAWRSADPGEAMYSYDKEEIELDEKRLTGRKRRANSLSKMAIGLNDVPREGGKTGPYFEEDETGMFGHESPEDLPTNKHDKNTRSESSSDMIDTDLSDFSFLGFGKESNRNYKMNNELKKLAKTLYEFGYKKHSNSIIEISKSSFKKTAENNTYVNFTNFRVKMNMASRSAGHALDYGELLDLKKIAEFMEPSEFVPYLRNLESWTEDPYDSTSVKLIKPTGVAYINVKYPASQFLRLIEVLETFEDQINSTLSRSQESIDRESEAVQDWYESYTYGDEETTPAYTQERPESGYYYAASVSDSGNIRGRSNDWYRIIDTQTRTEFSGNPADIIRLTWVQRPDTTDDEGRTLEMGEWGVQIGRVREDGSIHFQSQWSDGGIMPDPSGNTKPTAIQGLDWIDDDYWTWDDWSSDLNSIKRELSTREQIPEANRQALSGTLTASSPRRQTQARSMADISGNIITDTASGNRFRSWVHSDPTRRQWAESNDFDSSNDAWNNSYMRSAWSRYGEQYRQFIQGGQVQASPGDILGGTGNVARQESQTDIDERMRAAERLSRTDVAQPGQPATVQPAAAGWTIEDVQDTMARLYRGVRVGGDSAGRVRRRYSRAVRRLGSGASQQILDALSGSSISDLQSRRDSQVYSALMQLNEGQSERGGRGGGRRGRRRNRRASEIEGLNELTKTGSEKDYEGLAKERRAKVSELRKKVYNSI